MLAPLVTVTDDPFDPNARLAANKDALTDAKKNTLSSMISKADNLNKNGTSPARGCAEHPSHPDARRVIARVVRGDANISKISSKASELSLIHI